MDDWETFSVSPYQQPGSGPGASPVAIATGPFLLLDWPDSIETVNAILLLGRKGIWFDLLEAEQVGLSGQDIQNRLKRQGIEIHARALYPMQETITAIIVVDAEDEARARKALANMGVLLL